jgi:hypothetical protein
VAARCDVCGGYRVVPREIDGVAVGECGLCGALQGDDDAVALVERRREARRRGLDPRMEPLVRALESVGAFRVAQSGGGDPDLREYPYVFLRVGRDGIPFLERLLTSLEMANRETKRRWVVELALQHGMLFILRPRFWKAVRDITEQDIREAQGDLEVLGRVLGRDVRLAWWQAAPG